jgi:hypothetical protein
VEWVAISGPLVLSLAEQGLYTAVYSPPNASEPLTFAWDNGTFGSSAAYSWALTGSHTLAVTATNPCGEVSGSFAVDVLPPSYDVYLPLVQGN